MADYYSILKKTIASLPESNGAARRSVYSRARNAIVNQLKAYEPPLSPSEITSEQLRLEEAIRKVEAEAARESLGLEPSNPPAPAPPVQSSQPTGPAPASVSAPVPEAPAVPPVPSVDAASRYGQEVAAPVQAPVEQPGVETPPAPQPPQASENAGVPGVEPVSAQPELVDPDLSISAQTEPDYGAGVVQDDDVFADETSGLETVSAGITEPDRAPRQGRQRPSATDALRDTDGNNRLVPILGAAVAAIVVLGGAAYFFLSSPADEDVKTASAPVSQGQETAAAPEPAPVVEQPVAETPSAAADSDAGKNTDRLLNDSNGDVVAPDARTVTTTTINPQPGELVSSGQPSIVTNVESSPATAAPAPAPDAGTVANEALPQDSLAAVTPPAADPQLSGQAADTGVQRAILYEEGTDASAAGTAAQGAVVWELSNESDLSGQAQSVLSATVEIPERDVKVDIRIKPNDDTSLPASHLVEIKYALPDSFAAGDIVNVPGLVMKPTEEARGDALIGASVKVSPGFFWIALSSLPNEQQRNMALLRERGWIDIPMLYENGKRGILTLEKGSVGADAVEKAVAAWQAG